MAEKEIVVAVAGNPNVGKSTLFNVLTGETAHVANWPGVTVELKQGIRRHKDKVIRFIDLPGTYGISALSLEETIAREFIINGKPDVVLVLADSTAPERTLYLPIQVLELTPKVVIALTKSDLSHSMGVHIHVDKLEALLGVPVIPVSAIKGYGIRELLDAIVDVAMGKRGRSKPLVIDYDGLEPFIREIETYIADSKALKVYPTRWAAVRLLEGDSRLEELMEKAGEREILSKIRQVRLSIKHSIGKEPSEIAIVSRFNYVDNLVKEVVVRVTKHRVVIEKLEKMFQHVILGPIVSLTLLFLIFFIVFAINTGFPLNLILRTIGLTGLAEYVETYNIAGILELLFDYLSDISEIVLNIFHAPLWLTSLIVDGVIPGIGSVLTFLPLIVLVAFFLSILEDSGIAPRIAIAFNNVFVKFGLTGRAVFPYIISLGCNVPGVLASRASIEDEERTSIIVSAPFIPCQARLIVILAFITSYLKSPVFQAGAIVSIYILAFFIALVTALITRKIVYRKEEKPELILEIPPIHKPSLKVVWWLTWDYSKHFLKKAGTIIFLLSIITWYLISYGPMGLAEEPSVSYGALLGRIISPLLLPFGVDPEYSWKTAYALINGFVAKESLIETIVLLEGGEVDVSEALLALRLTPIQAYSLLVFMVLYVPCLATLAVIYMESRSIKVTIGVTLYMVAMAYIVSLLVFYMLSAVSYLIAI